MFCPLVLSKKGINKPTCIIFNFSEPFLSLKRRFARDSFTASWRASSLSYFFTGIINELLIVKSVGDTPGFSFSISATVTLYFCAMLYKFSPCFTLCRVGSIITGPSYDEKVSFDSKNGILIVLPI